MSRYLSYFCCVLLIYCTKPVAEAGIVQFIQSQQENLSLPYIRIAGHHYSNGYLDSTRLTFLDFFGKVGDRPQSYPADDWVDSCYQLTIKIYQGGDYELLTDAISPLLRIKPEVIENREYGELGKLINILGMGYKNQGFIAESIPVYLLAQKKLELCDSLSAITLIRFYINFGNALRTLGDLSQAYKYYSEALRQIDLQLNSPNIETKSKESFFPLKANMLNSLGLTFQGLGKHNEALKSFSESLEISEIWQRADLRMLNNNIGISHMALMDTAKASFYFKLALLFYDQPDSFDKFWVLYSLNYSNLLINMGKFDESEWLLSKILEIGPEIQGVTPSQMSTTFIQMASIQGKKENFQSGIQNIDAGLSLLTTINNPVNPSARIPEINLDNSPFKVIQAIKFRARIYNDWGMASRDTSKLMTALDNYGLAEVCIDSLRGILQGEESKINLSRLEKTTYAEKMDLLWRIHSQFPSPAIIAEAFRTAEKGKAAGIWNLIQLSENKEQLLPVEIVKKEKTLRTQIADFENLISTVKSSRTVDQDSINSMSNQKFLWEQELDSLNNYININFPDFISTKFENRIFSIEEIKNMLNPNQVMVQYFFSENYLHEVFISRDSVNYHAIAEPDTLIGQLKAFYEKLKLDSYDYSRKDVASYQKLAWSIYNTLLIPAKNILIDKDLIILPDEILAYIPFETLVTSDTISPDSDFRDLQYLLYQNHISYSFTASMWAYRKLGNTQAKKSIFGVAPSYDVPGIDTSALWRNWESQLPELSGTLEEVKLLKKQYRASTISGKKATEKKFKESASEYKILHMAMHTFMDEDNPVNSCLVFTPFADQSEDGRLHANEIRNLKLNSSLTILSACKSGTGRLLSGEGVMSLSRMFILAGSSSVIMTLWSVDDQTSLKLIENFYRHLSAGETITTALCSSKLDFLAEASKLHAHPYFWSGFIQLGRDTEIQIVKKNTKWLWYAGGAILAGLIIILLFFKKTKPRPGRSGL